MPDRDKQNPDRSRQAAENREQDAASRETKRPSDSVPVVSEPFATLPAKFGRYQVERLLGRGAMGGVYLARDTELDRLVALKIPKVAASGSQRLLQRLKTEAKAAAQLDHPCLCKVYDAGEIGGQCFIAMQYIEGETLKSQLEAKAKSVDEAVSLIMQIAEGLSDAHAQGIIHRDLKPDNIMINRRGSPVIMDFGLAKLSAVTGQAGATQAGTILGTPIYMAPEQAGGNLKEIDQRSDIYALGVILFELLTGKYPFSGSAIQILGQKSLQDPPSPLSVKPDLPPQLSAICHKMIAKEKSNRYQSLTQVIADLRGLSTIDAPAVAVPKAPFNFLIDAAAPSTPRPKRSSPPPVPPRVILIGGGALAAAIVLIWGITLWFQTADGAVVKVEVESPDVEVTFNNKTIKVADGAGEHQVTPGNHTLHIKSGIAEFDTKIFTLKKGNNPAVTVAVVDDEIVAKLGKKEFERRPVGTPVTNAVGAKTKKSAIGPSSDLPVRNAAAALPEAYLTYAAGMAQADRDFEEVRVPALQKRLDALRPKPNQPDVRGWEWYYLHSFASRLRNASTGPAYYLAYSPDGKYIATLGSSSAFSVLDAATWQPIAEMPQVTSTTATKIKTPLAWSPDSKTIVAGHTLKLIDVGQAKVLRELLPGEETAQWAGWNVAATHLAAACGDGKARVWRTTDWKLEFEAPGKIGGLMAGDWDSSGKRLLVGGMAPEGTNQSGATILFSLKGEELSRWSVTGKELAWQPSGDLVAIPRAGSIGIEVWNAQSAISEKSWFNVRGGIFQPEWSHDGQRLGYAGVGGQTQILDVAEKFETAASYRFSNEWIYAFDFSRDGQRVSIGAGTHRAAEFEISEPAETRDFDWEHSENVSPEEIAIEQSGDFLAATDDRRGLAVWSLQSPRKVVWKTGPRKVRLISFDGHQQNMAYLENDQQLIVAETASGKVQRTIPLAGHKPIAMTWPANKAAALQLNDTGEISSISPDSNGEFKTLGQLGETCQLGSFSRDGSKVVAITITGRVRIASGDAYQTREVVDLGETKPPIRAEWNADATQLAIITANRAVKIWDAQSRSIVSTLEGTELTSLEVAWNNTGDRIAVVSLRGPDARHIEPDVTIWDTQSGHRLLSLAWGHEEVRRIAWSHDGRQLGAFDKFGRVRIWDATRGYHLEQQGSGGATPAKGTTPAPRPLVSPAPVRDADRQVAEWVLSLPQSYRVEPVGVKVAGGPEIAVGNVSQLPTQPFKVSRLNLVFSQGIDPAALAAHVKSLTDIESVRPPGEAVTRELLDCLIYKSKLKSVDITRAGYRIGDAELRLIALVPSLKQLILSDSQVTDKGLEALASVPNIDYLALDSTQITDAGLVHLRHLSKLDSLHLSDNAITSAGLRSLGEYPKLSFLGLSGLDISDDDLKSLGKFASLRNLSLTGTRITDAGLLHLKNHKQLERVYLNATKVTQKGIDELKKLLPSLKSVTWDGDKGDSTSAMTSTMNVDREIAEWAIGLGAEIQINVDSSRINQISKLPSRDFKLTFILLGDAAQPDHSALIRISKLTSLDTLIIRNASLITETGISALRDAPALATIALYRFKLTEGIGDHFSQMKKLKRLDLSFGELPADFLRSLGKSQCLDDLVLNSQNVTGIEFAEFPPSRLQKLSVQPVVSREGLAQIAKLKSLTYLDVQGNVGVDDEGVREISGLSELHTLLIHRTSLTDRGLEMVARCRNLRTLWIQDNKITDEGLKHLAPLQSVYSLNLEKTGITDAGMEYISSLKGMQSLWLTGTKVSTEGLKHLRSLPKLNSLYLPDMPQVDDTALDVLKQIPTLRTLNISRTSVTSEGVKKFKAALPTCQLYM